MTKDSNNPFLTHSLDMPWQKLRPELIAPAIEQELKGAQAALDAISALPLQNLTYANTLQTFESATYSLNCTWAIISLLQSVAETPELREAYSQVLPKVTEFFAGIHLNQNLWARIKAYSLTEEAASLRGVRKRYLEETLADFVQSGADLPDDKRSRLQALETELAQLTQRYGENVLDATNDYELIIDDPAQLAGIPPRAVDAAYHDALSRKLASPEKPAWRFSLHAPSVEPVITYAENETLRRTIWEASASVGTAEPYFNGEIAQKILALRQEKAELLGHPNFATYVLQRRMAKTPQKALNFITNFQERATPYFAKENEKLETFAKTAGHLAPWSISYFAEKLRQKEHDFDEELLRPYFPLDRAVEGLFALTSRLFNIRISNRKDANIWHPEVRCYDIHDSDGQHLGAFYTDLHPREGKRAGAWMGYLITGKPIEGSNPTVLSPHLGYICANITPPTKAQPVPLLTHREVETLFHEFGHLLHHLLGRVEIPSLNGVNVAWDFVELPSQIMENWCWERESLDLFARHHETGETIPDELFKKISSARNFRSASATMRQVQFAKMDLLLHVHTPDYLEGDLAQKTRKAIAETIIPTNPPTPSIVNRFSHIFSEPVGYAAGYYSYKWAEVLDADAFTRFKKEGILNAKTGADFVRCILSKGNSAPPEQLYEDFMHRQPDIKALLARSNLIASDSSEE